MKHTRILCCLLLVLVFALSGCHGSLGKEAFQMPESFDESRTYEITFWAKNDTNLTQVAIYQQAIADFQRLYPNIHVNLRLYTDYGKIYNDVITNIATDTSPNVCITYPDHIATYATGGNTVVALDQLLAHPQYGLGGSSLRFDSPSKDEVVPQFLGEGVLGGKQYAIPFMRSTEACYVNRTMVEQLGYTLPEQLTWDFIWEVSQAAMEQDSEGNYLINGQKVMIPFIYKSTDNMMIQWLYQNGAPYADADGNIRLFNETTASLLETVAKYGKSGVFSTFKISSYPGNFLNAGQCIFAIDSTAGATWMGTDAPNIDIAEDKLVEFDMEVMEIPQAAPGSPKMISQGPSLCVFNKDDPQEVLASWLFAQFLLTDSVQIAYAQTEGYVPVTLKAQNSQVYQDYLSRAGEDEELYYSAKIQASQLLIRNTQNTFVTPVFNGSASLRDAAGALIENTVKGVRRGQTFSDRFLQDQYDSVTSLYRLTETGSLSAGKADLGPLPVTSALLLGALVLVWVCLGIYCLAQWRKKKISHNP